MRSSAHPPGQHLLRDVLALVDAVPSDGLPAHGAPRVGAAVCDTHTGGNNFSGMKDVLNGLTHTAEG